MKILHIKKIYFFLFLLVLLLHFCLLSPLHAQSLLERTKAYYSNGEYQKLLQLVETTLNTSPIPVDSPLYFYLGSAYYPPA